LFREGEWGEWVEVKERASQVLLRDLAKAKRKGPVTLFMSSATDPYQPVEAKERVTRALLETLADNPPDFLFVQTRSPLVVRDIDLFQKLEGRIRVSVTVETDLEEIRRAFTPQAPPIAARLRALRVLKEAGVPNQAAVSPVLPFSRSFPARLAEVVDRVCLDDFFLGDGSGGKRTEQLGIGQIHERLGLKKWYGPEVIGRVAKMFASEFEPDRILLSRDGFLQKSRLKAHGFNRGMKGGVARHPLLGVVRATNLLNNRTYERCSSHW
jgi:DNA repair photolyase